jgi:hypothetical protein
MNERERMGERAWKVGGGALYFFFLVATAPFAPTPLKNNTPCKQPDS